MIFDTQLTCFKSNPWSSYPNMCVVFLICDFDSFSRSQCRHGRSRVDTEYRVSYGRSMTGSFHNASYHVLP